MALDAGTVAQSLWQKIDAHRFDPPGAHLTFAQRLARENGWSAAYANRAIDEYKRFVFLAATSEAPVTPSDAVDQVWHLHLQYTENYWSVFCSQVLGRPLHHGPTAGGAIEDDRYRLQYEYTVGAYKRAFSAHPPVDIWPDAEIRFSAPIYFKRVDTRRVLMMPKLFLSPATLTLKMKSAIVVFGAAALLLLAMTTANAGTTDPVYSADMLGWIIGSFVFFLFLVFIASRFIKPDPPYRDESRDGGPVLPFDFDGDDER